MSKAFVLVTAVFAMVLLMLSAGSMSAQVQVHKLGRPWEVDNAAVPYFDDGSHTSNSMTADRYQSNTAVYDRPAVEKGSGGFSPLEVRPSDGISPLRRSYIRDMFSFFTFLHL